MICSTQTSRISSLEALLKRAGHHCFRALLTFLSAMFLLTGCESNLVIVNDLYEKEANEIIVFLATHDITATKIANPAAQGNSGPPTWNIAVTKTEKMRSLSLLNSNGLPRRRGQNLLGLFQKQGLVSSEMEEKIRYQAGLAEQIANTIRKIDGVLDADIQISFPQEESLPGQKQMEEVVTASVYVKHQGVLDNPNSHLLIKIKRLVSSAIQGLDFDNVTVVADRAIFNEAVARDNLADPDIYSVWGIMLVRESLVRFQTIFFSVISILALSLVFISWLLWKLHLILPSLGGFGSFFSPTPWSLGSEESEFEEEEEEDEEEDEDEDEDEDEEDEE